MLEEAGFKDPASRAIAAAIGKAESDGYIDAVGDIAGARLGPYTTKEAAQADYAARQAAAKQVPVPAEYRLLDGLWYVVNPKWGTSRGWFQIRILDDPNSGNADDRWRVGEKLGDALYNAKAAFVISNGGTDWSKWSVFQHDTYRQYMGQDYELRTGHARADDWNL